MWSTRATRPCLFAVMSSLSRVSYIILPFSLNVTILCQWSKKLSSSQILTCQLDIFLSKPIIFLIIFSLKYSPVQLKKSGQLSNTASLVQLVTSWCLRWAGSGPLFSSSAHGLNIRQKPRRLCSNGPLLLCWCWWQIIAAISMSCFLIWVPNTDAFYHLRILGGRSSTLSGFIAAWRHMTSWEGSFLHCLELTWDKQNTLSHEVYASLFC